MASQEERDAAMGRVLRELIELMRESTPDPAAVVSLTGDHIDVLLANTRRRKGKLQSDPRRSA